MKIKIGFLLCVYHIILSAQHNSVDLVEEERFIRKCRHPASYDSNSPYGYIYRQDVQKFMQYFGHLMGNYQPDRNQIRIPQMVHN